MTDLLLHLLVYAFAVGPRRVDRWMHARYLRSTHGGYRA